MPARYPGFDGLRLLAAAGVLAAHATLMPDGQPPSGGLAQVVGGTGWWGVMVFFVISGFLLAQSLEHDGDALRFAVHRTLRILPGFAACVLATALLLGPAGSALPWATALLHPDTAAYLRMTLDCLCAGGTLPGGWAIVRAEPIRHVVNGSLWSLSFEVLTYLLLLALWVAFRRVEVVVAGLVALALATGLWPAAYEAFVGVAYTLPFFAGGAAMHLVVRRFGLHGGVALACAALFIAAVALDHTRLALATVGAYLIVWLGARSNPASAFAQRFGDLSYGLYLYGWPVQMLVRHAWPAPDPWAMLLPAAGLTLACAWLSLRFIEEPALRWKRPLVEGLRRLAGPQQGRADLARRVAGWVLVLGTVVLLFAPGTLWWALGSSAVVLAGTVAAAALGVRCWPAARARWPGPGR